MTDKKRLPLPVSTIVLFVLAAALLLFSTIGGTRAALTYFSEDYVSQVSMYDIGITLVENGKGVSWRDYKHDSTHTVADGTWNETTGVLLGDMLGEGESLVLGKSYPEALSVKNSGTIDEYVRLSVYRYWIDKDGKKVQSLSPDLIDLNILKGTGWMLDEKASTAERLVFYYNKILRSGETAPALSDTIIIKDGVSQRVTQTTSKNAAGYTVITTHYDYDGYEFRLEAECDGVQTHNAADAIKSAWGVDVSIGGDGSLSVQ